MSKQKLAIIIGPIGSGKTFWMRRLFELIPNSFPIDGDILDLDMKKVMSLKKERAEYTRWQIIKAYLMGMTPIISTGGGVLCSFRNKSIIRNLIKQSLGIDVEITLYVANDTWCKFDEENPFVPSIITSYKNNDNVSDALRRRIDTGEWTVPDETNKEKFIKKIVKYSRTNSKFVQILGKDANVIISFPLIGKKNYSELSQSKIPIGFYSHLVPVPTADMSTLSLENDVNNETNEQSLCKIGNFMQLRILCGYNGTYGHITVDFSGKREIKMTIKDIEKLKEKYCGKTMKGELIRLSSGKNNFTFVMVNEALDIHEDNSSHITVNSGNHVPVMSKTLTLAIRKGEESCTIPNRQGEDVTYDLSNVRSKTIDVFFETVFAI